MDYSESVNLVRNRLVLVMFIMTQNISILLTDFCTLYEAWVCKINPHWLYACYIQKESKDFFSLQRTYLHEMEHLLVTHICCKVVPHFPGITQVYMLFCESMVHCKRVGLFVPLVCVLIMGPVGVIPPPSKPSIFAELVTILTVPDFLNTMLL